MIDFVNRYLFTYPATGCHRALRGFLFVWYNGIASDKLMKKTISFSFKNLLAIFIIIFVLALIAAAADYLASKYRESEAVPIPAVKAISQQEIENALSREVPVAERPRPLTKEEIQKALNKKINK